jgi:hypothetical protein
MLHLSLQNEVISHLLRMLTKFGFCIIEDGCEQVIVSIGH